MMIYLKTIVAICMASLLAACATPQGRGDVRPNFEGIVKDVAGAHPDAIQRTMAALGYDGVIVPHQLGPSANFADANIFDIGGLPDKGVWMSLRASPCVSIVETKRAFDSEWRKLTADTDQTTNDAYYVMITVSSEEPSCLRRFEFWRAKGQKVTSSL